MKIKYHFKKCISCGLCVSVCPNIWGWGDDGKARLKKTDQADQEREEGFVDPRPGLQTVVENCPTGAIKLEG